MNYLITGAGGPLGFEIARYLIEDKKCKVLCITRSKHSLQFNGHYKHISGIDLLSAHSLKELYRQAELFFKEPFHILNAVGYYDKGQQSFLETDILEADLILKSNYTAVYNTAHTLLPLQIKNGGGHFIGFSCDSTNFNYPLMNPFISAKSALNGFIKCLANEFYKDKIVPNAFALTTVLTEMEMKRKPNGDFDNWLSPIDVAQKVYELTHIENIVCGNIIKLYKYSESFFHQSYYERISK